ncbi:MAG: efflux RND transporter permease subunit, partial [Phycisphaerales bacterium]|nr:efflux RND transporter permease subunit [Phycisphaerales bacterium]
ANVPDEEVASLPPISRFGGAEPFDPVGIDNFFIGAFGGSMFVGATSRDERVVIPIGTLLTGAMMGLPDTYGGARQASIFGRGVGGGTNSINVEISGPDLERVTNAASMIFGNAMARYPGNVSSEPGNFNLTQPEWTLRVNHRGRELGLTTGDLAEAVRGLFDGAFVDDFRLSDENVDMVVLPEGGRLPYKEKLAEVPITTPAGATVPLDSVVDATITPSPQTILRIEELPAVSISIVPPAGQALEAVMTEIETELVEPARRAGLIDSTMFVRLEGTAAKLDEVRASLFGEPGPGVLSAIDRDRKGWRLRVAGRVLGGLLLVACLVMAAIGVVRGARTRRTS